MSYTLLIWILSTAPLVRCFFADAGAAAFVVPIIAGYAAQLARVPFLKVEIETTAAAAVAAAGGITREAAAGGKEPLGTARNLKSVEQMQEEEDEQWEDLGAALLGTDGNANAGGGSGGGGADRCGASSGKSSPKIRAAGKQGGVGGGDGDGVSRGSSSGESSSEEEEDFDDGSLVFGSVVFISRRSTGRAGAGCWRRGLDDKVGGKALEVGWR
jgi:hypothetical protein